MAEKAIRVAGVPAELSAGLKVDASRYTYRSVMIHAETVNDRPEATVVVNGQVELRVLRPPDPPARDLAPSVIYPATEQQISELASLIADLHQQIQSEGATWLHSSEELIRLLHNLLDDRDALHEALIRALGDQRSAESRADLLDAQLQALIAERLKAPGKTRSRQIVGGIAKVVGLALLPIIPMTVEHTLFDDAKKVAAQAVKVEGDCTIWS